MRDLETISTAITAAETGHLVFATLHTSVLQRRLTELLMCFHHISKVKFGFNLQMSYKGLFRNDYLSKRMEKVVLLQQKYY